VFGDDVDVILTVQCAGTSSITYGGRALHDETQGIDGRSMVHVMMTASPPRCPLPGSAANNLTGRG
jgi:hypothetical protein